MKQYTLLLFFFAFFINANAQKQSVDTVQVFSEAMHKNFPVVVIKPTTYKKNKTHYPVVYLLHGYSGSYNNWIVKMPAIKHYADLFKLIIVCPEGGYSSWYINSPVDSSNRFETFISSELIGFIDGHYKTIANKNNRAISGLSMGGHGALMLAMRHQDVYGAASSLSGAVDLNETVNKYDTKKEIGDTAVYASYWKQYSVLSIADTFSNRKMPLMIDCGINDIFIKGNRSLHQKLMQLKIAHDYVERNGVHNWDYWTNALPYHLLFFDKFFNRD